MLRGLTATRLFACKVRRVIKLMEDQVFRFIAAAAVSCGSRVAAPAASEPLALSSLRSLWHGDFARCESSLHGIGPERGCGRRSLLCKQKPCPLSVLACNHAYQLSPRTLRVC